MAYHIYLIKRHHLIITLVSKIDVATIQTQPPLNTGEQYLSHYFHNRLWDHSSAATIKGAVFNQVNMVFTTCSTSDNGTSTCHNYTFHKQQLIDCHYLFS